MASARVRRLEKTYAEINAGDLEQALEVADPEIVWQTPMAFPGAPRFQSRVEVIAFFTEIQRSVAEFRIDVERYVEQDDHILVIQRQFMRGAESGIGTERRMAHLWHFVDERAVAFEAFHDVDEATEELHRRTNSAKRE